MPSKPAKPSSVVVFFLLIAGVMGLAISATIGIGLALGWVLSWLIPTIGFGTAVVISLISIAMVVGGFVGVMNRFSSYAVANHAAFEDLDEEDEEGEFGGEVELSPWQVEILAEQLSEAMFSKIDQPLSARGKRRR
jgi:hypothetical protein